VASERTKLALGGLAVILIVAGAWALTAMRATDEPGAVVELTGPMPELAGESVAAGTVGPDDYRGRPVVVNFWATWCGPCRREQPALQRLAEEYDGRVAFVGVNHTDDRAAAREYLRQYGVTYPSVFDPVGEVAYDFEIPYLPATVIVDADGRLRYRLLGAQTETGFRRSIDAALPASA
jgi:cytochrome c biogenesis protein CcmG, thiol:disulfide interchange protein DsbE